MGKVLRSTVLAIQLSGQPLQIAVDVDVDVEISLQQSACFGRCPEYAVTVHGDGSVEFSGNRFVAAPGPQQGRADPARLGQLRELLQRPAVEALAVDHRPGQHADHHARPAPLRPASAHRSLSGLQQCPGHAAQACGPIDEAAGPARWISQGSDR